MKTSSNVLLRACRRTLGLGLEFHSTVRYTGDMETSFPFLPPEIEAAVAAQHGGPVAVPSRQGEHIVMSMAAYLEMMGINSEEQFKQTVAELRISLAQADAGDTMSLEEARQVLTEKHGT